MHSKIDLKKDTNDEQLLELELAVHNILNNKKNEHLLTKPHWIDFLNCDIPTGSLVFTEDQIEWQKKLSYESNVTLEDFLISGPPTETLVSTNN